VVVVSVIGLSSKAPGLTAYCLLLTTYYLLLTTYYLLLTTYYLLTLARCGPRRAGVLLTTYYLLLTTYYLPGAGLGEPANKAGQALLDAAGRVLD